MWPRNASRRLAVQGFALLFLLFLGAGFFASFAHLQLATDDVAWLQGNAPTVFDQYRKIPRLFFVSLHALWGPNAVAALVMIFAFHALNTLLVYTLGKKLLGEWIAALMAAGVVLINPVTLSTLTWISCFSYVLGTSLALLALLACWQAIEAQAGGLRYIVPGHRTGQRPALRAHLWAVLALVCFGAGLFCSHEIFFLPFVFWVLSWLLGQPRRGAFLCLVGMAMAGLVNLFVYDFEQYGVEASRLISLDFAAAYSSSALSSGLALALAYPLSFFVKTLDFLRVCFAEPVRWGMTAVLLAAGPWLYKGSRTWRLIVALVLSFLALITPYIIRLYLTPDTVNYHISYALSGRVFYLPFVAIALVLGWLGFQLYRPIQARRWAWLVWLLPLAAYGHALWLYDPADFLGLNVAPQGLLPAAPPRWNPYAGQHAAWLLLLGLGLLLLVAVRRTVRRKVERERLS